MAEPNSSKRDEDPRLTEQELFCYPDVNVHARYPDIDPIVHT